MKIHDKIYVLELRDEKWVFNSEDDLVRALIYEILHGDHIRSSNDFEAYYIDLTDLSTSEKYLNWKRTLIEYVKDVNRGGIKYGRIS